MATASTFREHTYTGEADLDAIASLINACREADDLDSRTSVRDLREAFASPGFDPDHDLRLWKDVQGNVVAMATLWHDSQPNETEFLGSVYFNVHPHLRGDGLEDAAMIWAEQRLREVSPEGLPLVFHTGCRDKLSDRKKLLRQFGFTPIRYFYELKRSLEGDIAVPSLPNGWKIRPVDANSDATAWVAMFNQSFVDHWNHTPMTLEEFHHYTQSADYNPALDLVIETDEGTLVTFCYSAIDPDYNQRLGRKEGYVCLLGTRRGYRRRGLARTLLMAGLQRLQARGMDTATIGVDAENPSGAFALYKSVGFSEDFRSTVYRKVLSP